MKSINKYTLSIFLIVIFGIYVFYQKADGVSSAVYVASNNAADTSSNSPISSSANPIADTSNSSAAPIKKTSVKTVPNPTPAQAPKPAPAPVSNSNAGSNSGAGMMGSGRAGMGNSMAALYKDGNFTGSVADAYYGNIQVSATISGGNISDVAFLQYPNDRGTSIAINGQAMPILKSEAIQVQNANVDIVSGATDSSLAFRQSLASALAQAKN